MGKSRIDKKLGEVDFSEFPSWDKFLSIPRKQIEYYKKISLYQYLKTSIIDVDIIYSNYHRIQVEIYDGKDFNNRSQDLNKGGYGEVQDWSQ